jgi:hypothetical protein
VAVGVAVLVAGTRELAAVVAAAMRAVGAADAALVVFALHAVARLGLAAAPRGAGLYI